MASSLQFRGVKMAEMLKNWKKSFHAILFIICSAFKFGQLCFVPYLAFDLLAGNQCSGED